MDTIEQAEAPIGGEDVTSSQDTASQVDTQTSTPAIVDGDTTGQVEGNAPEALLAGKYKTQEDLVDGYKNLESKIGELGQKASVADMLQEKLGITPDQLSAQIQQMEEQQRQERYANNPIAPLEDKVQYLESVLQAQETEKAQMALEREVDSYLKENPAFEANREQIIKLSKTPGIGFDPITGQDLGSVGDIAHEYFGAARAQGQQDAYNKIEMKENTQATGVSSVSKKQFGLEDLAGMSASDMEKVLPHSENTYI
jgi:hypothetical protein